MQNDKLIKLTSTRSITVRQFWAESASSSFNPTFWKALLTYWGEIFQFRNAFPEEKLPPIADKPFYVLPNQFGFLSIIFRIDEHSNSVSIKLKTDLSVRPDGKSVLQLLTVDIDKRSGFPSSWEWEESDNTCSVGLTEIYNLQDETQRYYAMMSLGHLYCYLTDCLELLLFNCEASCFYFV